MYGLLLAPLYVLNAQMAVGSDTLYGNEWINYNKTYLKIKISEDGLYRLPATALVAAGFPQGTSSTQLRLFAYGREVPIFCTVEGPLGGQDFLEFWGEKNRDQAERPLFAAPDEELVNPWYSMFTDTAVYFLTWETAGTGQRFKSHLNNTNNPPAKEPWCWFESRKVFTESHTKREIIKDISYSFFDGNGFSTYPTGESRTEIRTPNLAPNAPRSTAGVRYACNLNEHLVRTALNDSTLATSSFLDWKAVEHRVEIDNNLLKTNNLITVKSSASPSDFHTLSGAWIRYPRMFSFGNVASVRFDLDGTGQPQYLEIEAFNVSGGAPLLYDLDAQVRVETQVENGLVRVVLPPYTGLRRLFLVAPNAVKIGALSGQRRFRDYRPEQANYLIVSHPALYESQTTGSNQVEAYAQYRRSVDGGAYKVTVVDVEELYDQFAYGARFNPLSIRNFLHYAKKQWPELHYTLLLGKPLDYNEMRSSDLQAAYADSLFFVPTHGTIGADWPFAMAPGRITAPIVALGRLAVTSPREIRDYLEKLKTQEREIREAPQTLEDRAWMRRVIHNSGGGKNDDAALRSNLNEMATVIRNNRVGAEVLSYFKTSNDPIQEAAYERVLAKINEGTALWTIYGHSAAFSVAFEIGRVENYDNKDRYPFMMVLGCYAGLCSAKQRSLGEQFVLAPERGAIAYCASVNLGELTDLYLYGRRYYERLGAEDYGQSIGDIMRHTINDLNQNPGGSMGSFLHQVLLQGDPAVRLYPQPGPDYVVDRETVSFDPNPISIEQERFKVSFEVANLGQYTQDQLVLRINQQTPDGKLLPRLLDTVPAPAFRQRFSYELPTKGSQLGFNRFFITLDPFNALKELPDAAEANNELADASGTTGVEVFFFADDVQPIAPSDFGIVGQAAPSLYASTLKATATEQRYLFELDTVELFNSSFKKTYETRQKGGLIAWKPVLNWQDSTVYYWRIARDSLVNGQLVWRDRSFLYLKGSPEGWNASHYGQYVRGSLGNLKADADKRELAYSDNAGFLSVQVAYRGSERYPGLNNAYFDGFTGDWGLNINGATDGVMVAAVNPRNGRFFPNKKGGPYSLVADESVIFPFVTRDSLQRIRLMDFLENVVPDGYYVGLLALGYAGDPIGYAPQRWALDSVSYGENLFSFLEARGAKEIRQALQLAPDNTPRPYGLIYQKGNPQFTALDTFVNSADSATFMAYSFPGKWPEGFWESQTIGPALRWHALHWELGKVDDPTEEVRSALYAVRPDLPDTLLLTFDRPEEVSLAQLDAAQYPLLKWRYQARDTTTRTLTPLRFARILFDGPPEGAMAPQLQSAFYRDTLQQGETLSAAVAFANVSGRPMDSVLVKFRVENAAGTGTDFFKRHKPLGIGDTLMARFKADTRNLTGAQRLIVDANPNNDQTEAYRFNNTWLRDFWVARDGRNPLLDVTFDGTRILNGDIVSPKPEIVAILKDDNRFLPISDTTAFTLSLETPDGARRRIYFNNPDLVFTPADPNKMPKRNEARLEWRPYFANDGEYRLHLNGKDAAGNESAALDYVVAFKVINQSGLSNLLNYPNPFSTSTCFVYTMTGAEPPVHFKLQILTVSGRVVREVTGAEFGALRPGTHRSDFCWDGKDNYGDQLANGVYLYRVVAKKQDGTDFSLFENNSVDGFFQHGFGKMVLMR